MRWAPYEFAGSKCSGGPKPGARALLAWLLENYPQGWSGGIYNCRTVRGSSARSTHGEGRAADLMLPVVNGRGHPDGYEIVRRLGAKGRELGVQAVIFDRTIWTAASPNGRYYGGVHPHYDHLHIELTKAAADRLTLATFRHHLDTADPWEAFMATLSPKQREFLDAYSAEGVQSGVRGDSAYRQWLLTHRALTGAGLIGGPDDRREAYFRVLAQLAEQLWAVGSSARGLVRWGIGMIHRARQEWPDLQEAADKEQT